MYKTGKGLCRNADKLLSRFLTISVATLTLVHFNSAIGAEGSTYLNFDSDGSKFRLIDSQHLDTEASPEQVWLSGDFDGNGMDDLIQISKENNTAKVEVRASDGEHLNTYFTQRLNAGFWPGQRWLVGNFNNDDYDDLLLVYSYRGTATAWIYTNTGTSFSRTSIQRLDANFWNEQRWEVGNFGGDGSDDLVLVYNYRGLATAWIYTTTEAGFTRTSRQRLGSSFSNNDRWKVGNFDGLGYDDLLRINSSFGGTAVARFFINNGDGFVIRYTESLAARFWDEQRWEVGDVDRDNLDDVILIYGHNPGGATAWMFRSTGTSLAQPTTQRLNWTFFPDFRWLVTDMDGDDRAGLALIFTNDL